MKNIAQIVLYDRHGKRVGLIYPRRAKQLILNGRAAWVDEGRTLKMLPEIMDSSTIPIEEETIMEEMYNNNGMREYTAPETPEPAVIEGDVLLMYKAKQNVKDKRNLRRHIFAYIAAWVLVAAFSITIVNNVARRSAEAAYWNAYWDAETAYWDAQWITDNAYWDAYVAAENAFWDAQWDMNVHFDSHGNAVVPDNSIWDRYGGWAQQMFPSRFINDWPHEWVSNWIESQLYRHSFYRYPAAWLMLIGAMLAWGGWILFRIAKRVFASMRGGRPKYSRPDPVIAEYNRLRDMAAASRM